MMKYEKDNPQTAPILQAFAKALLSQAAAPPAGVPERLSYYKCNMNSIVGDGETIPWPLYTSRLDIEPELAVVYGNARQPVAGFCIFNDVSARDVQAQEFIGGFCLTKDMDKGNQLGPCLVTADEVGRSVRAAGRRSRSTGRSGTRVRRPRSTTRPRTSSPGSDSSRPSSPERSWASAPFRTAPASITTTSSIRAPRSRSASTGSGSLRCRFAEPARQLLPSRWPVRPAL